MAKQETKTDVKRRSGLVTMVTPPFESFKDVENFMAKYTLGMTTITYTFASDMNWKTVGVVKGNVHEVMQLQARYQFEQMPQTQQ